MNRCGMLLMKMTQRREKEHSLFLSHSAFCLSLSIFASLHRINSIVPITDLIVF